MTTEDRNMTASGHLDLDFGQTTPYPVTKAGENKHLFGKLVVEKLHFGLQFRWQWWWSPIKGEPKRLY